LKAARESTQGGWLGNDDDQTGELTLEMAEQAFAQALAAQGSFGIAKIVTAGLERKQT
jgi:Rod binding domain-containing protein